MLSPWHRGGHSPIGPTVTLHLSAAGVMLVSNLTMGLYIHFVPASQNSTIANKTLVSSANLPAEPTNYITLIPLLATMFFIMGRCRERDSAQDPQHRAGYQPGGTFLIRGRVIRSKEIGLGVGRQADVPGRPRKMTSEVTLRTDRA